MLLLFEAIVIFPFPQLQPILINHSIVVVVVAAAAAATAKT